MAPLTVRPRTAPRIRLTRMSASNDMDRRFSRVLATPAKGKPVRSSSATLIATGGWAGMTPNAACQAEDMSLVIWIFCGPWGRRADIWPWGPRPLSQQSQVHTRIDGLRPFSSSGRVFSTGSTLVWFSLTAVRCIATLLFLPSSIEPATFLPASSAWSWSRQR